MPQASDPLAQLRDIHMPGAIGWWPLAPGWWIIATLLLAVFATTIWLGWRTRRQNRYRRLALKQLEQSNPDSDDPQRYLQAVNQLLKQTLLSAPQPVAAMGLTGSQWLAYLNRSGNTTLFSEGAGRLLLEGPYLPPSAVDTIDREQLRALHCAVQQWIKQHRLERQPPEPKPGQHQDQHQGQQQEVEPC